MRSFSINGRDVNARHFADLIHISQSEAMSIISLAAMSSEPPATKSKKIKQVLKSAALLPVRVTSGRGTGRNNLKPRPGEPPVVIIRIQVLGCLNLLAKDRGGTRDP